MISPAEISKKYSEIGTAKANLPLFKMLLLSIMAGIFISMAGVGASTASCLVKPAALSRLISGMVFPAGLAMVLFAGSELFTGNCLLILPLLEKKITFFQLLRNWVVVYIGNLIGSLAVCAICVYGGQFSLYNGQLAVSAVSTAAAKCSLSFGDAFLKGIGCNFLVCIAVWIALGAKDMAGKMAGLYFPVLIFVVAGFEHCIANMFYIPAGLMAITCPEYLKLVLEAGVNIENLNILNFAFTNLVPVTLGNIIGGGFIGAVYWACYLKD